MKYLAILAFALFSLTYSGCDVLHEVSKTVMAGEEGLSDADIIGGLKQALEVGTGNAANILNKENGYFGDPLVKIAFPQEAQRAADKLNQLGMSSLVNNFVEKMNRGAERAASEAKPIFVNAVKAMTFADARQILTGPDNAATEYFKGRTTSTLYGKFSPVIQNTLEEVKAATLWNKITTTYNKIPLVNPVNTNLTDYVTNRALDGLFLKLAGEEKKIRTDPVARVTDLLKKVFGSVAK